MARMVSIWLRYLATDGFFLRQPFQKKQPFVLRTLSHGRMVISATNATAEAVGIHRGMALADARALHPDVQVADDQPELTEKILLRLAEWCIRFTPLVSTDPPDGLLLDASGCCHLWGSEELYLKDIHEKLRTRGYHVQGAMADTVGVAWGVARFANTTRMIISEGKLMEALMKLPPQALRIEADVTTRLHKLGLHQISQLINMPRASLRKRFGIHFLQQLDKAIGTEHEWITPVNPIELYQERLPCLEPISTATGIEIALRELLTKLCLRLQQDQKGLRTASFKCYRVDGAVVQIAIGTNLPTYNVKHLFKLFELKIATLEPALGIELFVLEASKVETYLPQQEKLWEQQGGLNDPRLSELLDKIASKLGAQTIQRYLPDEHYWPERSVKRTSSLSEQPTTAWQEERPRPMQLLSRPEAIEVTAPIPDYPPMLFRYKGAIHKIIRADGPERIEQEWWLQQGQHRDYYRVEDEQGNRFWLFRSGHYHDESTRWYLHGFFA